MAESLIVRRSWITYVRPVLAILVLLVLGVGHLAFYPEVMTFLRGANVASAGIAPGLLYAVPLLLLLAGIAGSIWKMVVNRSHRLTITPEAVIYESGVLPWRKEQMYWKHHHIYRAVYRNDHRFLGWLLRFGSLVVVGKEGSTREWTFKGLHDPKRAQLAISRYLE